MRRFWQYLSRAIMLLVALASMTSCASSGGPDVTVGVAVGVGGPIGVVGVGFRHPYGYGPGWRYPPGYYPVRPIGPPPSRPRPPRPAQLPSGR